MLRFPTDICDTHPAVLSCKAHHFGYSEPGRSYSSPQLTWDTVSDHIFSSHLCLFHDTADLGDPSRIVSSYDTPWWIGDTAIPNKLWQWDQVIASCVCHYQHWLVSIMRHVLE